MWELVTFALLFGPAVILLFRFGVLKKEDSRMAWTAVVVWTAIMLFNQWQARNELRADHDAACEIVFQYMNEQDPVGMEDDWQNTLPIECYRYTSEYAQDAADYAADNY